MKREYGKIKPKKSSLGFKYCNAFLQLLLLLLLLYVLGR